MIKILHIAYGAPFPPQNGYNLRVWNLCREFSKKSDLSLLFRTQHHQEAGWESPYQHERIEVFHHTVAKPLWVNKIVKGGGGFFRRTPLMAEGFYFSEIDALMLDIICKKQIDVVILEGAWLVRYWPRLKSQLTLRVLDAHNIEEELLRRSAKVEKSTLKKMLLYHDAWKMRWAERRLIKTADLVFLTSERERDRLAKLGGTGSLIVAPNGVDCRRINYLKAASSKDILFVGAMDYFPNVDGILFFAEQVYPEIRRIDPEVRLHIVGRSPVDAVWALGRYAGIKIHGGVADVTPFYSASAVVVVPLRTGGGTRLKILEAMAFGRPVVSTSIGCEGLDVENRKHLLVADNAMDMRDAVVSLLGDRRISRAIASHARQLVESRYDWGHIAARMFEPITEMVERRKSNRGLR